MDAPTRTRETDDRAEPRARPGPTAPPPWAEVDGYYFDRLVRRTPATDVYLAHYRAAGTWREVVIVQHLPDVDPAALRRAVDREVYAAGALMPPGAAPVVDVGHTRDGRLYVATARPIGRSLREVLDEDGAMAAERALELGLAVTHLVATAHDAGLVHGWLTPESVVVVPKQGAQPERVVVLGFGTAAAQDGRPQPVPFAAQLYPYASPERAAGAPASAPGDVFSLGTMMLSMLSGAPPPAVRGASSPDVGLDVPELRPLGEVLARARTADPHKRYASAAELEAALGATRGAALGSLGHGSAKQRSPARWPATRQPVADVGEADAGERVVGAPFGMPVPGALRPADAISSDGRRGRRAGLLLAGAAGALAVGAAFTWRSRAASDAPPPLAEVTRKTEPTPAPPVPSTSPALAARPPVASAVPNSTAVQSIPPADAPPTGAPPAAPRTVAQNTPPTPSEGVESRTMAVVPPAVARTAAPVGTAPVRNGAPAAQRGPAIAGAVPVQASAQGTGRAVNSRTAPLAAPTGSAAGEVLAGMPSAGVATVGSATGSGATATRPNLGSAPGGATASAASASAENAGTESAASTAAGVRAVVAEYATAIQARDVAWLRRVYPGMTEQQRSAWVAFFGSVADLRTRLAVGEITPAGGAVRVRVQGTYEYQNLRPHRAERLPVSFTATLARDASGWRVRTVE